MDGRVLAEDTDDAPTDSTTTDLALVCLVLLVLLVSIVNLTCTVLFVIKNANVSMESVTVTSMAPASVTAIQDIQESSVMKS